MRRSYQTRKLERHSRKPAELLLVPMIDIFTVLVTFLLMTAVFSRTVILQLNLPASQAELSPDIATGDAPATPAATGGTPGPASPVAAPPAAAAPAAATPLHAAAASGNGAHP